MHFYSVGAQHWYESCNESLCNTTWQSKNGVSLKLTSHCAGLLLVCGVQILLYQLHWRQIRHKGSRSVTATAECQSAAFWAQQSSLPWGNLGGPLSLAQFKDRLFYGKSTFFHPPGFSAPSTRHQNSAILGYATEEESYHKPMLGTWGTPYLWASVSARAIWVWCWRKQCERL